MPAEMITRDTVRYLVDLLPDDELPTAARVLQGLLALDDEEMEFRRLENAPEGEPLTENEAEALREAEEDLAEGRVFSREEMRQRLGLR